MDPKLERMGAVPPLMLGGSLWAIRADALPRLFSLARIAAKTAPPAAQQLSTVPQMDQGPGVAIITLCGVLTPFGSFLSYLFGGGPGGVQGFRDQLARAVGDPNVAAIVLDIDSPGGSVGLTQEAAADVRAARDIKPVYAVANVQACSGAYYIGSQATELYCTPSGTVGSIGVYYVHEDYSGMNEQMGIDVTYIYAGQYKVEGNMDEPLSDDAKAAWQADADKLYAMFVNDVAAGRGVSAATVRSDFGEGRVLLAQDALDAGMVDGVDTIQAIVARAVSEASVSTGASARRLGHATGPRRVPLASAQTDDDEPEEDPDEIDPPGPPFPSPHPDDEDEDDDDDDDDAEGDDDGDPDDTEEPDPQTSRLPRDPEARRLLASKLIGR